MPSSPGGAPVNQVQEALASITKSLHHVLVLTEAARDAGDLRDAAECVIGAVEELAPALTVLARFLRNAL